MSSFALKILALFAMTCNHVANVFEPVLPAPLYLALFAIGGAAFPILGFLLVEGFSHTSSKKRYLIRLLVFGVVSQVPYSLLWGLEGNVMLTLSLSLATLWACEEAKPAALKALLVFVFVAASAPLNWGLFGPIFILLAYLARKGDIPWWAPFAALMAALGGPKVVSLAQQVASQGFVLQQLLGEALYLTVGIAIAAVASRSYDGTRGPRLKWSFYLYYPLHLLVIWVVSQLLL